MKPCESPGEAEQSTALRWFLVLTKPASEQLAKINLSRQGYNIYYPRIQKTKRYRDRWVDRIVALFPRYLFVQLDMTSQSLAPVRSTVGVANVVRFGGEAATVPDDVVNALIGRADPESGLHRLFDRPLKHGAPVSIVAGALEGLEGIFERDAGDERAVILLSLLGRSMQVCMRSALVMPAPAQ
jgi:transcriptional antiterminator RfaH